MRPACSRSLTTMIQSRSPDHLIPWWVLICVKRSPIAFLVLSVACFFVGIVQFSYLSSQVRAIWAKRFPSGLLTAVRIHRHRQHASSRRLFQPRPALACWPCLYGLHPSGGFTAVTVDTSGCPTYSINSGKGSITSRCLCGRTSIHGISGPTENTWYWGTVREPHLSLYCVT